VENRCGKLDKNRQNLNGETISVPETKVVTQLQPQTPECRPDRVFLGGKRGNLHLVPLQPKLDKTRRTEDEVTIGSILNHRLNKLCNRRNNKNIELLDEYLKYFSANQNMKIFRLNVEFHDKRTGDLLSSEISNNIQDTGNKTTGALEISDVIPRHCCSKGGKKVVILSKHKLDTRNVVPELQVWAWDRNIFDFRHMKEATRILLNQPTLQENGCLHMTVENQWIIFLTPSQEDEKLEYLNSKDWNIRLVLKRQSDDYTSSKLIEFKYFSHGHESMYNKCVYCEFDYNDDETKIAEEAKSCPGSIRRIMTFNPAKRRHETLIDTSPNSSKESYSPDPTYVPTVDDIFNIIETVDDIKTPESNESITLSLGHSPNQQIPKSNVSINSLHQTEARSRINTSDSGFVQYPLMDIMDIVNSDENISNKPKEAKRARTSSVIVSHPLTPKTNINPTNNGQTFESIELPAPLVGLTGLVVQRVSPIVRSDYIGNETLGNTFEKSLVEIDFDKVIQETSFEDNNLEYSLDESKFDFPIAHDGFKSQFKMEIQESEKIRSEEAETKQRIEKLRQERTLNQNAKIAAQEKEKKKYFLLNLIPLFILLFFVQMILFSFLSPVFNLYPNYTIILFILLFIVGAATIYKQTV